ncbi:hypothetical protein [Undibacterium rugosum]|nr:hypothetical protein [Undibacterium rugosum]
MLELNQKEVECVSGGIVVDPWNLPPGIFLDERGNPVDKNGNPLF